MLPLHVILDVYLTSWKSAEKNKEGKKERKRTPEIFWNPGFIYLFYFIYSRKENI